MKKPIAVLLALAVPVVGIILLQWGGSPDPMPLAGPPAASWLTAAPDVDPSGPPGVDPDAPLRFPEDHGVHPAARTETWGLFGQLVDGRGTAYDLQLDLLRVDLAADPPPRASAWATSEIYRGRLTLRQPKRPRLRSAERLTRSALGLAGPDREPVAVRIQDWSLSFPADASGQSSVLLVASGKGLTLDLALRPGKAPLAFGDLGLLGRDVPTRALQSYVMPRLAAAGTLTLDGETGSVEGAVWLDHAWGALPTGAAGLGVSRFAILLDRDRELVCLRLRREDGTGTPIPACALILADGRVQSFRRREIELEPSEVWTSALTGARYPLVWRLSIPMLRLSLDIRPLSREQGYGGRTAGDQAVADALGIWSGVVQVSGQLGEQRIAARGRIETTAEASNRTGT